MKLPLNERASFAILVIPTVIVVMVLAGLLYRWSNQVSESTSVRLADSLQMSMVNWHLNLFRDLSDICVAMRVDPGDLQDPDQYARRFAEWKTTAPYPGIVANLRLLKSVNDTSRRAFRLDPSDPHFEPDGPAALASLDKELQSPASVADTFYAPGISLAGWRFEPNIPALLHPVNADASDWMVIELDRNVIQTRILPDLASRYFTGIDGLDYMVAVVAGTSSRDVIYSSDPEFGAQEVTDADGRMDVFGHEPIYVFQKHSDNPGLTGLAASIGTSWFPIVGELPEDRDWQLIVRHRRGGALGAFVAEMHHRDLAISFGVLFLLIVSVAMLIVTSQRAHHLAKLKMDFVTAVSHELRTPLTIISSAAENIAHGLVESKQQVTQYGSVIESQARQLSGLVEEILLFAATSENRHRYNLRRLEIVEIVDATLAAASGLIEAAHFTLECEIPASLPPVVGDLAALSQCLQNLITNALKYGTAHRWVGIRAAADAHHHEVRIEVSDRGMGIEPADLPHIFEPFYRSPSAVTAQVHGTGLGLSLARSIAEAMHGSLTVASEPHRGSTFTLHLPVTEMAASESQ